MASAVLLDTWAAIWLMNGDKMTDESRRAIRKAQEDNAGVYVSAITAWEVGTLVSKNKIELDAAPQEWFDRMLSLPDVRLAELTPQILIHSTFLAGQAPSDPADRMIAATARQLGLALITRDIKLILYGAESHFRVIRC